MPGQPLVEVVRPRPGGGYNMTELKVGSAYRFSQGIRKVVVVAFFFFNLIPDEFSLNKLYFGFDFSFVIFDSAQARGSFFHLSELLYCMAWHGMVWNAMVWYCNWGSVCWARESSLNCRFSTDLSESWIFTVLLHKYTETLIQRSVHGLAKYICYNEVSWD